MSTPDIKSLFGLAADFTPVVGEAKSAYEAVESYKKGDMLGAALGAAGAIPLLGKAVKPIRKGLQLWDNAHLKAAAKEAKAYKSKEVLTKMDIDDFLTLSKTPEYGFDPQKLENLKNWDVDKAEIPHLTFDKTGQVTGHEGRHRAKALKELGETEIPVRLKSRNIRFDQQDSKDAFDYVAPSEWPKYLKEEEGARVIRFPVKHGQSGVIRWQ